MAFEYSDMTPAQLQEKSWTTAGAKLFAPTGGIRVEDALLRELRLRLEQIALQCGYPADVSRDRRARFDDEAIQFLSDFPISHGEAIRAETWAWIAVVLVPHVVKWRWTDRDARVSVERFAGSLVRNAVGRLWYQAFSLDRGKDHPQRWLYSQHFTSDQAVALLERPSLAASHSICLAVGKAWTDLPQAKRKEVLFRETMKALIVRAGWQRLDVLDQTSLDRTVNDCFETTLRRLSTSSL